MSVAEPRGDMYVTRHSRATVGDAIAKNNKLAGKTFLFTGSLTRFTRDRAKQMVEENGGTLLSGVSAKLHYLVAGEDAGSKLAKAKAIPSIEVLTEEEFLGMV